MTGEPSTRRYLSLWLPFLSTDVWRLDTCPPPQETRPLVLVEKLKGAQRVAKADACALAEGLAPGMSLADARARVPYVRVAALDLAADAAFLDRLADTCLSFSPSVAADLPDGLALDITGCAHLFSGEAGLAAGLKQVLQAAGVSAVRIAVAPVPEMARALARFGRGSPLIVHDGGPVRALPVAALECAPEDALALRRAGLRTIGDVADRPTVLFSARFTPAFTARLARILGHEDRRLSPLPPAPVHCWEHRCAEPVVSADIILQAVESLARRAKDDLEQCGAGGRVFEVTLLRTDGAARIIRIETSRPTRDADVIMRLYRDRLDALADPLDPGFGFDLIRCRVLLAEPMVPAQPSLDERAGQQEQVCALLDRLAARFGKDRVVRLAPVDTHIPERAQAQVRPDDKRAAAPWPTEAAGTAPSRPLQLFARPQPIEVEGAPAAGIARLRWRRVAHEIAAVAGPERIAPDWWNAPSDHATRDYYRVETAEGRRFWIFRADVVGRSERPRWFLHGVFP